MSVKPTDNQLMKLIGNPEAFAAQQEDGAWYPLVKPMLLEDVWDHLKGEDVTYGTYVLWGDKAKTLVFDIDEGEDTLGQAEAIRDELVRLGFPPRSVGIEFSGKKGHHVWMVLADFVPAKDLRRIGRLVLGITGLRVEVFPKQDEAKKLGNLVKLPGGIHQVSKKENNFVDRVPQPMSIQVLNRILESLPPEPEKNRVRDYDGVDGVLPCLAAISAGVGDGSRNTSLYQYAVLLRGSHRVPDHHVDMLVRDAAANCTPPYEGDELETVLESSREGGPVCEQLPPELRCPEEECVKTCKRNGSGLVIRPGQLRGTEPGEPVVVTLEDRKDRLVTLSHPDIKNGGKVSLK